ncbi:MAG: hypothetical protein KAS87_04755 [Candidatus Omnitrophica bacterium]|nr:hypothetical protein [Candidatus Omnitrophota bacterium]
MQIKEAAKEMIDTLPSAETKEVLDFICFIKTRKAIEFDQLYFWSKKWQVEIKESEKAIEEGEVRKFKNVSEMRGHFGD